MQSISYKDLQNLDFTIDQQLHVLKHFSQLDNEYISVLYKYGYSQSQIKEILEIEGSKFKYEYVNNPIELWQSIIEKIRVNTEIFKLKNNRCEIELSYKKEDYNDGIGLDSLISIGELSIEERKMITRVSRGDYAVQVIWRQLPPTWKVNVILQLDKNILTIRTIFPGKYAPSLPDHLSQDPKEYKRNIDFWENSVLINNHHS